MRARTYLVAQQQSVLPIRESNCQREIELILVKGFDESAVGAAADESPRQQFFCGRFGWRYGGYV